MTTEILDDNAVDNEEGVTEFEPNVELKLSAEKRRACRDIVLEIKNFGVSQRQMLFLIQLLAMELEDGAIMRRLVKTLGEVREQVPLQGTDAGSKIFVEGQSDGKTKKKSLIEV